jgi:CVNH domain-containing protein
MAFLPAAALAAPQESNPPGPYQQTCTEIRVKQGNLYAKCQDKKGKKHSAWLSRYEKCKEDIVNNNGRLECTDSQPSSGAEGGAKGFQPAGTYTETCRDIRMKGSTLHAICKNNDGREMPASLKEARHCSQGVINVNGVLNCAINDVLPPGSYLATCKDVQLQGTTLRAACNNGKDHWKQAELRDAHKCSGDIANHEGSLRCTAFKHAERR